jgi:cytochrome P450
MDTTSNALARILHLLSTNPDVQDKLRDEICNARKEGGDLDYEALSSLPYLDAVMKETLRV